MRYTTGELNAPRNGHEKEITFQEVLLGVNISGMHVKFFLRWSLKIET
jgi:hypothetical protein